MENKSVLETVNNSANKLLETQSLEELYATIVKETQKSVGLTHGLLLLKIDERFETVYSTSTFLKSIKSKKNTALQKALVKHTIIILTQKSIGKYWPELTNKGVRTMIIIPLYHREENLGIIILCNSKVEQITSDTQNMLELYGSLSSLAITKTRSHEELTKALEIRDKFISLASHELRTPLTSINGYIQLLHGKLSKTDSVEARWMQELYAESNRLTQLVKDLLDINRIKQGQLEFILREVDIKKVIGIVIERVGVVNSDHQILFEDQTESERAIVIGDSEKLIEMISALMGNAVKFSKPDTKIITTLRASSRWIRISIKDEGEGIPKKDIDKIFGGFYKTVYNNEKDGMGVGLFFAKHIIRHHKGEITINSKLNKGTIVEVSLPNARI